jgi:3-hydroxyisobutyrate dehydrogenase
MLERDFSQVSFGLELAHKDLDLIIDAAERHDADMPITRATKGSFAKAIDQGHGQEDMASVYFAHADGD